VLAHHAMWQSAFATVEPTGRHLQGVCFEVLQ
jgi:hypothetical protein